jgi:pimeloyl-ACP methyl ester carboxylesterase
MNCTPQTTSAITVGSGPIRGREALEQLFAAYLAAFEIHVTPEFLIAEGDMMVVYDTSWVKHTGVFQGIALLLLLGSESPEVIKRQVATIHQGLPQSQVVVLHGQGHGAMYTAPDLFVNEVVGFLAST